MTLAAPPPQPLDETPVVVGEQTKGVVARGPWALAWRRLRKDKVAMVSAVVLILIMLVGIFAPVLTSILGHPPNTQDPVNGLTIDGLPVGPNGEYWFGTDSLGRDVVARLIHGTRVSLGIGFLSTAIAVACGVVIGLASGFLGGAVDTVLARLIDLVLALPFLLVGLALVAIFGQSLLVTVLVISFFSWASMARIIRGQVLSLREREFVEAARSLGAGNLRIMFVEILPNLLMPIIVQFSLLVPIVIVTEATLAYLGLGLPVPTADWGSMISEAQKGGLYQTAWWMVVFPGGALLVTTLACNLLGDGIRDAFDPRIDRLLKK